MRAKVIFGPPGTGKTRKLIEMLNDNPVPGTMYVSHTRAAAVEAANRFGIDDTRGVDIQTLHSWCFKALKMSKAQTVDDTKLTEFTEAFGLDMEEDGDGKRYVELMSYARAKRMEPLAAYAQSARPGTAAEFSSFLASYTNWKKQFGYLDFSDMLMKGSQLKRSPRPIPRIFIDEAQDLSHLHWMVVDNIIALNPDIEVIIAGDDDQCQPPDTMVSTDKGQIRIADLVKGEHKIKSYSTDGGQSTYKRFTKTSRPYSGELVEVAVDDNISRYTPNHRCIARFNVTDHEIDNGRVVYLMKKGDWFRIGETKAFTRNANGVMFYPLARMRQEGADALWVLKYVEDPLESRIIEQTLAWEFGIPSLIFSYEKLGLPQSYGPKVLEALNKRINFRERAQVLLASIGLDINLPWDGRKVGGQKNFEIYAINLLPGLMSLGIEGEGLRTPPTWRPFFKSTCHYEGEVFSLDVSDNHTYFADGILTHNCLYSFAGADPHLMDDFGNRYGASVEVLGQSYRVPQKVHEVATAIIERVERRVPKIYAPTTEVGRVVRMGGVYDINTTPGVDSLILYGDRWTRDEVEETLLDKAIPYVAMGGMPAPLDTKAGKALRMAERYDGSTEQAAAIANCLNPKGKTIYENIGIDAVIDKLRSRELSIVNVFWKHEEYLHTVDVREEPTIRISTIHGAKGMEADDVHLVTAQSQAALREATNGSGDAQHRVYYVGATRARHNLFIYEGEQSYDI